MSQVSAAYELSICDVVLKATSPRTDCDNLFITFINTCIFMYLLRSKVLSILITKRDKKETVSATISCLCRAL